MSGNEFDRTRRRAEGERTPEPLKTESVRFFADGEEVHGGKIEVTTCDCAGHKVPMFYVGVGGEAERILFPQAFSFHPDAVKDLKSAGTAPTPKGRRTGTIFVVDTGWPTMQNAIDNNAPGKPNLKDQVDPINFDVVHEHGPAIEHVIRSSGGDGINIQLRQIRFAKVGQLPGVPVFEHANAITKSGDPVLVRGFTVGMLMATLTDLETELQQLPEHERAKTKVNLSLGAVACPEHLTTQGDQDLYNWLRRVTDKDGLGIEVVVAAGNHGTNVPTWPAAFGMLSSAQGDPIDGVHAVGSGEGPRGNAVAHSFSAWGDDWIPKNNWENGQNIAFDSYQVTGVSMAGDAAWSGTSFAAPQFAVSLLPLEAPAGGGKDNDRPKATKKGIKVAGKPAEASPNVIDLTKTGDWFKALPAKLVARFKG